MGSPNHHGNVENSAATMETQVQNYPRQQKPKNLGKTCSPTPNKTFMLTEQNHVTK